jgi:hypothetical protein
MDAGQPAGPRRNKPPHRKYDDDAGIRRITAAISSDICGSVRRPDLTLDTGIRPSLCGLGWLFRGRWRRGGFCRGFSTRPENKIAYYENDHDDGRDSPASLIHYHIPHCAPLPLGKMTCGDTKRKPGHVPQPGFGPQQTNSDHRDALDRAAHRRRSNHPPVLE